MAAPKLQFVRLLKNHGVIVRYLGSRGATQRFERPDGRLSIPEAACMLGTYANMVRRMAKVGRLTLGKGRRRVRISECRTILKLPRDQRTTADVR